MSVQSGYHNDNENGISQRSELQTSKPKRFDKRRDSCKVTLYTGISLGLRKTKMKTIKKHNVNDKILENQFFHLFTFLSRLPDV